MRYTTFLLLLFANSVLAQSRVKKISMNFHTSIYSYGEGTGYLNNVVRLAEDIGVTFKTYDTVKNKGMIYEFSTMNTTAYYKNVLSGNAVLEVNDLFTNLNFIFPVFILYKPNLDQSFGIGISIGTLAGRDYLDENNTLLPYNATSLKEIKFGKYWTSSFILDYELSASLYKRFGYTVGLRYVNNAPFHGGHADFIITQGNGFTFKLGMFYQLK